MLPPLVSVIVPVYNNSQQLSACLRALARQTHPSERTEIIVVDNGSDEDLQSIVAGFAGFRYESEERVGSYAARNKGIEASKGEILAFTDSDCLPEARWIEEGLAALERSPALGAVGGAIQMFARDQPQITAFDLHDIVWGMPQRIYIERFGLAATANLFARRSAFDQVGPFDPAFQSCGDCEWSFRLTASGLQLGYAPDARVLHPTRSSMSSFVRRRRRIAGGYHLLEPLIARSYPDTEFVIPRSFSTSIARIQRGFAHRLLDTNRSKAQFALAELLLYVVTTLESWRLRFGGVPCRG